MNEKIKIVREVLEKANPEEIIILSHADHDGLTSACLLDLVYFSNTCESSIKKLHPSKMRSYSTILYEVLSLNRKYFFIIDALVRPYKALIEKIVKKGVTVINLDHHDLLVIENENYIDLNPHNWNLEFMNSSGLCWLIVKKFDEKYFRERCWVAGIGAIQDYCIEDNVELMKELAKRGYIRKLTFNSAIDSELLKIAKAINSAVNLYSAETTYQLLFQAARDNDIERIKNDEKLLRALEEYKKEFTRIYEQVKGNGKIFQVKGKKIKFYNLKGSTISIISEICEVERENAIYVGYSNGLLGFRSLFYKYDVRKLAQIFGGGGPHPRVAGARTNKSFDQVVEKVINHIRKEGYQKLLDEFM